MCLHHLSGTTLDKLGFRTKETGNQRESERSEFRALVVRTIAIEAGALESAEQFFKLFD